MLWVKKGVCSADSLINLALCCLGFLPGMIHAWYIILNNPEHTYEHVPDHERQDGSRTTTYYYVSHGGPAPQGGQMNYGTVGSQPNAGQFPGQQTGTTNAFPQPKAKGQNVQPQQGVAGQETGAGEGSSEQPNGPPPTYADVIKGDHKVQKP
ncbi:uncharacterized protein N0V89_007102 [Didymosphaeria variabile]|uniref:Uncharacterized protein n=1 Tax=Didymosphaeria variabile TaxID=1932322 RepID=A0A9W9C962_9PLEO|nr:uncharacterized protein N0V89_007102 [Didymosphaeria variabile]KAJ4351759.1 hypothetical protein N0V89_007102 [Didymosphaeria variabile]